MQKPELSSAEQRDLGLALGRAETGTGMFELASNEVRRELGIMP